MSHPRKTIRQHVATLLTAATAVGLPLSEANVFDSRVRRLPTSSLPALLIYTRSDKADGMVSDAPRVYLRKLELAIEVAVAAADMANILDDLTREVEILLENDEALGGLGEIAYSGTEIELDGDADPTLAIAVMTFTVEYEDDLKTSVVDDFTGADVTWNLTTLPDEQNEAQDTITVTP